MNETKQRKVASSVQMIKKGAITRLSKATSHVHHVRQPSPKQHWKSDHSTFWPGSSIGKPWETHPRAWFSHPSRKELLVQSKSAGLLDGEHSRLEQVEMLQQKVICMKIAIGRIESKNKSPYTNSNHVPRKMAFQFAISIAWMPPALQGPPRPCRDGAGKRPARRAGNGISLSSKLVGKLEHELSNHLMIDDLYATSKTCMCSKSKFEK